jgi:hypothetical protein
MLGHIQRQRAGEKAKGEWEMVKNRGGKEAAIGKRPIGKGAAEDTAIEKRSAGKGKGGIKKYRNIGFIARLLIKLVEIMTVKSC